MGSRHYFHKQSGLHLTLYRAYDSDLGRWISLEPLGGDGPNLYHYVHNDPINLIDPDGLGWREWVAAVITGASLGWNLATNDIKLPQPKPPAEQRRKEEEKKENAKDKKKGDQGASPPPPNPDSEMVAFAGGAMTGYAAGVACEYTTETLEILKKGLANPIITKGPVVGPVPVPPLIPIVP